jgi:hypothetical protein
MPGRGSTTPQHSTRRAVSRDGEEPEGRMGVGAIDMGILFRHLDFARHGILSTSKGRTKMPDEPPPPTLDRELTSDIVSAYVRRNQIGADQLPVLISTVHQALATVGKPVAELDRERTPAVPIRRSVHRDYVVCLECGWRGQMLRRHLATSLKGSGLCGAVRYEVDRLEMPIGHCHCRTCRNAHASAYVATAGFDRV